MQSTSRTILILGGGRFIGPHLIRTLRSAGHKVETFTRSVGGIPEVEANHFGDRNDGFSVISNYHWDCVIDTSCYLPKQMKIAAKFFKSRTAQYIFVSTINVYQNFRTIGVTESAKIKLPLFMENWRGLNPLTYGHLKASCERKLEKYGPENSLTVRPGYLCGPCDPSKRLARLTHIIATSAEAKILGKPSDFWQLLDVRDLCEWLAIAIAENRKGIYNLVGPENPIHISHLVGILASMYNQSFVPIWNDVHQTKRNTYAEIDLMEWAGLPPRLQHLYQVDNTMATQSGLSYSPIYSTINDTYQDFYE